jgi:hypothetical protein
MTLEVGVLRMFAIEQEESLLENLCQIRCSRSQSLYGQRGKLPGCYKKPEPIWTNGPPRNIAQYQTWKR